MGVLRKLKRQQKRENKKALSQMKSLTTEYFIFIDAIPRRANYDGRKDVENKLNDLQARWQRYCDHTPRDSKGYKPSPDDLGSYISNIMGKRQAMAKGVVEVMEPTIWQRFVRVIWWLFVPSRHEIFKQEFDDGAMWKYAYDQACKVKLWYHIILR